MRIPAVVAVLAFLAAVPAAADEPFVERVGKAIDRGVAWLEKNQREDGSWGRIGGEDYGGTDVRPYDYPAGPTSLALLTLLKCGVKPKAPSVARGFAYLEAHRIPKSPYELSMLMLAIEARANPYKRDRKRDFDLARAGVKSKKVKLGAADKAWMEELTRKLLAAERGGGWRYAPAIRNPQGIAQDMSNTQLAMMALFVAHRAGVDVPPKVVLDTIRWTLAQQDEKGPRHIMIDAPLHRTGTDPAVRARGWAYARKSRTAHEAGSSGSMTTGAIVVLLLARDMLAQLAPKELAVLRTPIRLAVRDGLAWLDMHWTVAQNPPRDKQHVYHLLYLYGLERVGDILRKARLGGRDWYREGATWLLDHQREGGHWDVAGVHPPRDVLNTCFALLFLDRASLSVVTRRE